MLRCYKTSNPAQFTDFESNLFSEEDKLHTIVFDYAADKVTIDSVDYVISKIEESKNEPDQVISTTLGAITIAGGNMSVSEENSSAILEKLNTGVTETNSTAILSALNGISGGGDTLAMYKNVKLDKTTTAGTIYLGYEKLNATKWIIKKFDGTSMTFVKGDTDFLTNWGHRADGTLTYAELNTLTIS